MATEPGDESVDDPGDDPGPVDAPDVGGESASGVTDDEQTWGVLAHVSAFAGLFVPFGNILGPLLVWLVKKDESRFVDANGKQSLNFQISWTILMFVSLVTIPLGIGVVAVPLVALAWLILVVIAAVRASEKEVYDYPLTIDFVD